MSSGAILSSSAFNGLLQLMFNNITDTRSYTRFGIGTGTTTPVMSDTTLESTITGWAGGTATFKAYSTVSFDTINQQVTLRGFITASEANGVVLTEYADFNTLATPGIAGRFVATDGPTKTSAVQVTYITIYGRSTS
jgi:hypothetical protein